MTSSTRTCQLGKTCPQYQLEGASAPCPSLTASPLPPFLDSTPRIHASALPHPSTKITGPPSPIRLTPYSPPASAHPLPCRWRSGAAPKRRPSPTVGPGCCTSDSPRSTTTCQKRNFIPRHRSPFSHPSHPCPKQMGACLFPSTLPVTMQMSLPAHRHCQKRKANTVSEGGRKGAGDIMMQRLGLERRTTFKWVK